MRTSNQNKIICYHTAHSSIALNNFCDMSFFIHIALANLRILGSSFHLYREKQSFAHMMLAGCTQLGNQNKRTPGNNCRVAPKLSSSFDSIPNLIPMDGLPHPYHCYSHALGLLDHDRLLLIRHAALHYFDSLFPSLAIHIFRVLIVVIVDHAGILASRQWLLEDHPTANYDCLPACTVPRPVWLPLHESNHLS